MVSFFGKGRLHIPMHFDAKCSKKEERSPGADDSCACRNSLSLSVSLSRPAGKARRCQETDFFLLGFIAIGLGVGCSPS